MNIKQRQRIEHAIVKKLIEDAIALGYMVSHSNGEYYTIKLSQDVDAIMAEINQCDEERLVFRDGNGERIGSVFLAFGNDGHDVICDHSSGERMEAILLNANRLADQFSEAA